MHQPRRRSRIVVLCEGDTEEIAVRYFIARQWEIDELRSIALRTDNLRAALNTIGRKTSLYLDEDEVIAVFTLIDLQGMTQVKHGATDELAQKVRRVQDWLRSEVKHERSVNFYPHVSVHQIEAWILADGAALAKRLKDRNIVPDPAAELKNFANPPAQRINELFKSRKGERYAKLIDGRPLFSELRFEVVYRACPYFRAFYDQLRDVARSA